MAGPSQFAEGMKRVINGELNLDDFPPLHSDPRVSPIGTKPGSSSNGGSRASPSSSGLDLHGGSGS